MKGTGKKHNLHSDEEFIPETDTAPEDIELEDVEGTEAGKIRQLRKKLADAEEERRKTLEDLQRTKADFLNSKKRLEEGLQHDRERIALSHAESLLPLADSFEAAMGDANWEECDEKWRKGVEGIYAQLINILKGSGVTPISAEGMPFDPHLHDAVSNLEVDDPSQNDIVISVLQKGYTAGKKVLRHAKVVVGITK